MFLCSTNIYLPGKGLLAWVFFPNLLLSFNLPGFSIFDDWVVIS